MLNRKVFLVKERVRIVKLTDAYDIVDPTTGQTLGFARENISTVAKLLRLVMDRRMLPTRIEVCQSEDSPPLLTIRRGFTLFRAKVTVHDASNRQIGHFISKILTIGGGFRIFDAAGQEFGTVKGDWKGWNFQVLGHGGSEVGQITKKWAGIGKELLTSADNYAISISDGVPASQDQTSLVLAAGLALDMVFKEG